MMKAEGNANFSEDNAIDIENSSVEWTFYPHSGNRTYHTGKKCIFDGIHLRNKTTTSERTLEMCTGKKKYVIPHSFNYVDVRALREGQDKAQAIPVQSEGQKQKGTMDGKDSPVVGTCKVCAMFVFLPEINMAYICNKCKMVALLGEKVLEYDTGGQPAEEELQGTPCNSEHEAKVISFFVIIVNEVASRNGIPLVTPGDHPYACPEQSTDFHKMGSTRSPVNFGSIMYKKKSDTFIPLQRLPGAPGVPFRIKEKQQELQKEKMEVKNLDIWKPAPTLLHALFATGLTRRLTLQQS
ncbi:spermatogenesis-associated serine-rich protein 1 [Elgaria multicarinata webbii]|uniref:spermatogenesis-associated serine-rich protein 1 n=1 Tax=Elgaria multicarinata webbii TaxID=159646 RepID=UPI002FCD6513